MRRDTRRRRVFTVRLPYIFLPSSNPDDQRQEDRTLTRVTRRSSNHSENARARARARPSAPFRLISPIPVSPQCRSRFRSPFPPLPGLINPIFQGPTALASHRADSLPPPPGEGGARLISVRIWRKHSRLRPVRLSPTETLPRKNNDLPGRRRSIARVRAAIHHRRFGQLQFPSPSPPPSPPRRVATRAGGISPRDAARGWTPQAPYRRGRIDLKEYRVRFGAACKSRRCPRKCPRSPSRHLRRERAR